MDEAGSVYRHLLIPNNQRTFVFVEIFFLRHFNVSISMKALVVSRMTHIVTDVELYNKAYFVEDSMARAVVEERFTMVRCLQKEM